MSIDIAPDVMNAIQRQLATGTYSSPDELLREALAALESRDAEATQQGGSDDAELPNTMPAEDAIREAIEDLNAGRYRPAEEVSREIERKFNFRGE
jgi:Arc/MetJ-type ribon-helix-helix transcriptional regulator